MGCKPVGKLTKLELFNFSSFIGTDLQWKKRSGDDKEQCFFLLHLYY